ncbi:MAG: hypothetical protein AW07_03278 [Candidatus Accumulibacter sp. SK-11]|nr:MAG: hypothetical protein AW07_03278 [Candidatus Accumulibacter sp. SK-11]
MTSIIRGVSTVMTATAAHGRCLPDPSGRLRRDLRNDHPPGCQAGGGKAGARGLLDDRQLSLLSPKSQRS